MTARAPVFFLILAPALAQNCPPTPAYTPCELVFEPAAGEDPARISLHAEFKSPRHKTFLMHAFADAGKLIIRFTPTEPGQWVFRLSSSVPRWNDKEDNFVASPSDSPGFILPRNFHHWATDNGKPHLWMAAAGDVATRAEFDRLLEDRAAEKFTHLRITAGPAADLREIDERIRAVHRRGLVTDLVLAGIPKDRAERERYMKLMVSRYSAFNITWNGPELEKLADAKPILRDMGLLLRKMDPYNHPRGAMAEGSSSALFGDQWVNFVTYGNTDENLGSVEHQLYQLPAINTAVKDARELWRATMNGQYPAGGSGKHMTAWFDFMSGNRYWELEPYFEVDGARAIALEGIEYIVWVEKPGPIEVTVEKRGYDVAWINPETGERLPQKEFKGAHFTGEPPNKNQPWILHLSREGHKRGMLNSFKFDSREVPLIQEVEQSATKVPFEIVEPAGAEISLSKAANFAVKIKRETRATRSMMYLWTGEVAVEGQGSRVIGTGAKGTLKIPAGLATKFPAVLSVRVAALNANGKAYVADRVYKLVP
jgi:hypothetical protein